MGIQWRAVEIKNGEIEGYQFAVYAGLDDDPMEGLQKLYEKVNNGLSRKYIKKKGKRLISQCMESSPSL